MLLLSGCIAAKPENHAPRATSPLPTINSYFSFSQDATATPTPKMAETTSTPGALPTTSQGLSVLDTPTVLPEPTGTLTVTIFDEEMNDSWTLENSTGFQYDLQDMTMPHNGIYDLSAKPSIDKGELFFTVREAATQVYRQDQVISFSFWLYSGDDYVKTSDLTVSIIGSNQYPYWVANDNSVTNVNDPIFSATRLYYLGFNHDIPPKTWVQVEIRLDDLIMDPVYKYVTGMVIRNDVGFRNTLIIDDVIMTIVGTGS